MMNPPAVRTSPDALRRSVESYLFSRLDDIDLPADLAAAIRHALTGGKRLRPIVTLLACRAAGGDPASALPAAAALELVHGFSLVHDDLPAMDDDVLRRGRPTVHVAFGEALAILAGDAMLALAFDILARPESGSHGPHAAAPAGPSHRSAAMVGELSAATTAMIAGQVYDTLRRFPADLDEPGQLDLVHRNKTASLFRAAARCGAIAADADPPALDALTRCGEAMGIMFQIVDDILDVTATTEQLGKTAGKDEAAAKMTWPSVHGLDASRRRVEQFAARAEAALDPLGEPASDLRALVRDMAVRTR